MLIVALSSPCLTKSRQAMSVSNVAGAEASTGDPTRLWLHKPVSEHALPVSKRQTVWATAPRSRRARTHARFSLPPVITTRRVLAPPTFHALRSP